LFNRFAAYRDKKVVGVFVPFFVRRFIVCYCMYYVAEAATANLPQAL
jgi:hypothetical protein